MEDNKDVRKREHRQVSKEDGKMKKGEYVLIEDDFNARMGREVGAGEKREELIIRLGERRNRKLRDEKMNGEWRKLVEMIKERE